MNEKKKYIKREWYKRWRGGGCGGLNQSLIKKKKSIKI
tara:strand:+ start:208 stop:321 length:114 start_codon:yes stop_codon:yes gene_type:complete